MSNVFREFGTLRVVITGYNGTMALPADVSCDLERLRELCSLLPPKSPDNGLLYPFNPYIPDEEWIENTGSLQGALNHTLEVAFGSRATVDNTPIKLKSHGPDLLAVVDVLAAAITGYDGENPILINWVGDLIRAVEAVHKGEIETEAGSLGKRPRKYTEKRQQIEQENEAKASAKRKKMDEAADIAKAKKRTAGKVKQHELRLLYKSKDKPSPAVRFRDLSDLLKSTGHGTADTRKEKSNLGTTGEGTAEAPLMLEPEDTSAVTDPFDDTDDWGREIGLDDNIERPPPGARHAFEVTEVDGINLKAPTLLDLLSDEPIEGAIQPGVSSKVEKEATVSKEPKGKEKLSVEHFKF
ncbi:hypothetical protein BN14_10481 [Rhizoctonia solani AG-1 IB]|uniref:Uncharacterized protein n=1 Tax=Thanatephorus cucumeris (strain AG1-IB / isolate 7/3/14) TaxID=1108050 RepID=M5CGL9_THACB|nr:hypothetical protein BN14_10481 [Rhizoctonia solani AG-1 IB]